MDALNSAFDGVVDAKRELIEEASLSRGIIDRFSAEIAELREANNQLVRKTIRNRELINGYQVEVAEFQALSSQLIDEVATERETISHHLDQVKQLNNHVNTLKDAMKGLIDFMNDDTKTSKRKLCDSICSECKKSKTVEDE